MIVSKKKSLQDINGILLLDKPLGLSSNAALQKIKHLLHAKKAGHTGSLDPLASGMLPICLGEATKFSQFLLAADKTYYVKARLGIRTTTSDAEGEIVAQRSVPELNMAMLDKALDVFRGESAQMPSMFSALKHQGKPLYQLARQGIVVARPSRVIQVYALQLMNYQDEVLEFELQCSKGTYVRTIVDDLGEQLGCGAHVIELRRLAVGTFGVSQMHCIEEITDAVIKDSASLEQYLLPIVQAVSHMARVILSEDQVFYIKRGQAVRVLDAPQEGMVAITVLSGELIGVGVILEDGRVQPKRLIQCCER